MRRFEALRSRAAVLCGFLLLAAAAGAGRLAAGELPDPPEAALPVEPLPLQGLGLDGGLFRLKEMDFHLHSGLERPIDLGPWIDLAVADGRRVVLLLDHLELFRKHPGEEERARRKEGAAYPLGPQGIRALYADFDAAARKRKDLLIFKGWEVGETELDSGVELEPMRLADAIGWHISPNNGGEPPNGQTLLKRVRQIRALQEQLPIPMILFHPISMRLENLQRTAAKQGRDIASIPTEEYRYFAPGEQEELIRLLRGTSIYVEVSRDMEFYFENPACREALIADIAPLARAGVQFTISTDTHRMVQAHKPFDPDFYAGPLGVNERNTNAIVRELLALRARRSLAGAPRAPRK